MAFTEFTCRNGGNNLYAGSLDGSAEATTTPLVTYTNGGWNSGTGVFTPAAGNPVSAGVAVGNWVSVYADGASAPTGFVARVTAVSSTTITLSTTAKSGTAPGTSGTARTAVVGGAWGGPTGTSAFPISFVQNTMTNSAANPVRVNFKNDKTYSITAAMTAGNGGPYCFQGYTSSFNDLGRATIDGGTTGASYVLLTFNVSNIVLRDLIFQNNGATGTSFGVSTFGNNELIDRCVFHDLTGGGINSAGSNSLIRECEAYACNTSGSASTQAGIRVAGGSVALRCLSHDNSAADSHGFCTSNAGGVCIECVSDSNAGAGFLMSGGSSMVINSVAYNNDSDGCRMTLSNTVFNVEGCIFDSNGGYGVNVNGAAPSIGFIMNCAFRANTSGPTTGNTDEVGSITLTADPFVDAANGDFDLNNTAGGGAACRGTDRGTFTQTASGYTGTLGYPDVGASQHQDAGGGGLMGCAPINAILG